MAGLIVQLRLPPPVGSGSLTETPLAVPAPVLLSVTFQPIWSPASTLAASLSFLSSSAPRLLPSFPTRRSSDLLRVVTVAVLVILPQSALVVVAIVWTLVEAPPAS